MTKYAYEYRLHVSTTDDAITQQMRLEATYLRNGEYAVRPHGALGTCGWINGCAWTVVYVKARTASDAIRLAEKRGGVFH